ncbi:unnamed protein product [Linum trigynum]|uniref:Uncharacterized protein n=1 Tax=Linum trigynum TaxID=586398 RepID=A0AAV2FT16_9ROSI
MRQASPANEATKSRWICTPTSRSTPVPVTRERERATMGVGCPLLRRLNCALLEKEAMAHTPSRKEKKIGGGQTLCSSSVRVKKPKKKSLGWTSSALVRRSPKDERKKERAGG